MSQKPIHTADNFYLSCFCFFCSTQNSPVQITTDSKELDMIIIATERDGSEGGNL